MSLSNIRYVPSGAPVKSKQGIDIFKKRMEEAFASEEKFRSEVTESSSKQVRNVLVQIAVLLLICFISILMIYSYKVVMAKPVFCSPGVVKNCLACPDNSVCENGEFECKKPFVKAGYECIEDKEIIQKAYAHLEKIEKYVVGKSVENFLRDRSKYDISLGDIEILFKESETVQEKTVELLASGKSTKLAYEYRDGNKYFFAKTPFLGVVNLIQIFWEDNMIYIILGFIALVLTILKLIQVKKDRILRAKANYMYEMIRTQLKANVDDTPEHGIPEESLKDEISNQLGAQSMKVLWPIVESLRKSDKQVSKFEIHLAGRPVMLWQWADIRSLKPK